MAAFFRRGNASYRVIFDASSAEVAAWGSLIRIGTSAAGLLFCPNPSQGWPLINTR